MQGSFCTLPELADILQEQTTDSIILLQTCNISYTGAAPYLPATNRSGWTPA